MKKYGVSGTLGELNDQEILTKHYHVKIFKVQRNKPRIKPIYTKEKLNDINELFYNIHKEIEKESMIGRPVLVIMDSEENK